MGIVGAVANAIVAIFSILIWRVYKNQLATMGDALVETRKSNEATQKSNEIAKDTLEIGRRAWLVAALSGTMDLSQGERRVDIVIENVGGVPAIDVWVGTLVFTAAELPTLIEIPGDRTGRGYLGGGRTLTHVAVGKLSEEQACAITAGTLKLWLYLEAEYSDCFKNPRKTVSCWRYGTKLGWWIIAERHNYIT